MSGTEAALLAQARRHVVVNDQARGCWHLITEGIELGWLDRAELRELLRYLRNHEEFGVEELLFSYVGDDVQVSFLDDHTTCSPDLLIQELTTFLAA